MSTTEDDEIDDDKISSNEFGGNLLLADANGHGDDPHPWLLFDLNDGTVEIGDEPEDDDTARNFVLTKTNAVKLAYALLYYAHHGITSTARCVSRSNIERWVKDQMNADDPT
jgi:hypothetical protein